VWCAGGVEGGGPCVRGSKDGAHRGVCIYPHPRRCLTPATAIRRQRNPCLKTAGGPVRTGGVWGARWASCQRGSAQPQEWRSQPRAPERELPCASESVAEGRRRNVCCSVCRSRNACCVGGCQRGAGVNLISSEGQKRGSSLRVATAPVEPRPYVGGGSSDRCARVQACGVRVVCHVW